MGGVRRPGTHDDELPRSEDTKTKEQLARAVKQVSQIEPSLPDGVDQMSAYTNYELFWRLLSGSFFASLTFLPSSTPFPFSTSLPSSTFLSPSTPPTLPKATHSQKSRTDIFPGQHLRRPLHLHPRIHTLKNYRHDLLHPLGHPPLRLHRLPLLRAQPLRAPRHARRLDGALRRMCWVADECAAGSGLCGDDGVLCSAGGVC